jgi:hypothetical protein
MGMDGAKLSGTGMGMGMGGAKLKKRNGSKEVVV